MTEVVVVCEGQTEEAFVKRTLAPAFVARHVLLQPRLVALPGLPPGSREP